MLNAVSENVTDFKIVLTKLLEKYVRKGMVISILY